MPRSDARKKKSGPTDPRPTLDDGADVGKIVGLDSVLAERVGFEPTVGLHLRQFSRLLP